ncbi:MAG: leucine-rich repeat domain-containing protein, partial [Holosporales bacterium]|nr:leucine-rich repeat domain-containing protein [Holosporales bacterium]
MQQKRSLRTFSLLVLGVLGVLSKAEAMQPKIWEESPSGSCLSPRNVIAQEGNEIAQRVVLYTFPEPKGATVKVPRYPGLQRLCIPANAERLEEECFADCLSFTFVAFEANSQLVTVEQSVFRGCPSLQSIYIPASV